jgi:hypothetical protein
MQQIHVASKSYCLPHAPTYVVLVMEHGADRGEYYRVSRAVLDRLKSGVTPEELELDPLEETE